MSEARIRSAYALLDDRLADLDALLVAHHRERLAWHAERLRELGAKP